MEKTELKLNEGDKDENISILRDVESLKEWYLKQPHLPSPIDEEIFIAQVTGTKSLEIAKRKIDAYFSLKKPISQVLGNPNPDDPNFVEASKSLRMYCLPGLSRGGCRVKMISLADLSTFSHLQAALRLRMLIDLMVHVEPRLPLVMSVYDCRGASPSLLGQLKPAHFSAVLHWFQEAIPMKLKKVVLINAPPFAELVVNNMIKPFLKKKLAERIYVCSGGIDALREHIPLEDLPSDYGGNQKSAKELNDYWLNLMQEKRDWFLKNSQLCSDETKRPPESAYREILHFGLDGTFKTLSVD